MQKEVIKTYFLSNGKAIIGLTTEKTNLLVTIDKLLSEFKELTTFHITTKYLTLEEINHNKQLLSDYKQGKNLLVKHGHLSLVKEVDDNIIK